MSTPQRALDAFPGTRTEVSLTLPAGLSYTAMQGLLTTIGLIERASPWWGADALLYAENHYGERFAQVAEALGWSPDTLSTRLWVARAIPGSRRRDQLSFNHHAEVAALDADDQDHWLGLAEIGERLPNGETKRWSVSRLRQELRALVPAKKRGSRPKKEAAKIAQATATNHPPDGVGGSIPPRPVDAPATVVQRPDQPADAPAPSGHRVPEAALLDFDASAGILLEKGMLIRAADDGPPHRIVGVYVSPGEIIIKAASVLPVPEPEEPEPRAHEWAAAKWGTAEALAHLYNVATPDNVPAVTTLSPKRKELAKKALKAFPARTWWVEVFDEYHKSKFLSGRSAPGKDHEHFSPDFEWICGNGQKKVENAVRVHDGVYRRDGETRR